MIGRRFAVVVMLVCTAAAAAQDRPEGAFYFEPITPIGLGIVVDVEVAPDGRIFVLEKNGGTLRVFSPDGESLSSEWVSVWPDLFNDGDRGALGFALHPNFPEVPHIYIVHTVDDSPDPRPETRFRSYGRVVRYTASAEDPNRADPSSRTIILGETYHDGIPACFNSHTIGTIAFGHDGSLFVGAGDAASWAADIDTGGLYPECFSPDPEAGVHPSEDVGAFRSQRLESLAGKILRVDPETGLGLPSNPFYTGDPADTASKVWALGLRNPFRFSVAPPEVGDDGPGTLYVGDVGNSAWEELNVAEGGENFGWPCWEGPGPFGPASRVTEPFDCSGEWVGEPTGPMAYWHHNDPALSSPAGETGKSITGGVVYTGTAYPEAYRGAFFFADFASGWVRSARFSPAGLEGVTAVGDEVGPIVDLTNDPLTGTLLAADVGAAYYGAGFVGRLRYTGGGNSPPIARLEAPERTGEAPATLAFRAASSFDPDGDSLTYDWAFGDGATASGEAVSHTFAAPGVYSVTVTVRDAAGLESRASVSVVVGESMPEVEIVAPTAYTIPDDGLLSLRATATDPLEPDDGLRAEWAVDLVHNDHEHQRFFYAEGLDAEFFLLPHAGEGETAHYRATITVTDSEGLVRRVVRTFREAPASEVDVATAVPQRPTEGGVEVRFPRPVVVGRVGIPGAEAVPAGLRVEARLGGEWAPVRYPSALVEAGAVQVVFAATEAEAVRVAGADSVAVYARIGPDEEVDGIGEGSDVGDPVASGQVGLDGDDLVVVGGGDAAAGAFHMVRSGVSGDGGVAVRVDAIAAGAAGGAGVVLRSSLDASAPGVALLAAPGGDLVLWTYASDGSVSAETVGAWEGSVWLRLARRGARVHLDRSEDGADWEPVAVRLIVLPDAVLIGPAVAGGDEAATGAVGVGWFGEVTRLGGAGPPSAPAPGTLRVEGAYPNPAADVTRVVLDAGLTGGYRVEVVDVLGRKVGAAAPVTVDAPRQTLLRVDLRGLGTGTYLVRAVHEATGRAAVTPITVVR